MEQGLGSPDITLLGSVFGQGGINTGILFHKFPLYGLLKGTSQNFVNRTNCAGRNVLMLTLSTHRVNGFVFKQPLIISLNYAGGEILQLH